MDDVRAIVIIGEVTGSRRAPAAAADWLRRLTGELNRHHGDARLAPFGVTQGDQVWGLLRPGADPLVAVLQAGLDAEPLPMRWAIAAGVVGAGQGPATERSGEAFFVARDMLGVGGRGRGGLSMCSGARAEDALLADLAPLLPDLLDDLSPRQRRIAHLAIVHGLRQAEVAERLDVSRATISVTWARSRVRSIERLARALRAVFASGTAHPSGHGDTSVVRGGSEQ